MSGLARIFKDLFQAHYIAGLWSTATLEGLVWIRREDHRQDPCYDYTGPSWSWAGHAGGLITWPVESPAGWKWYATVQSAHVELKDKLNPYGEVKTAWLQLHGPIVDLRFGHQYYYSNERKRFPAYTRYSRKAWKFEADYTNRTLSEWKLLDLRLVVPGLPVAHHSVATKRMRRPYFQGLVVRFLTDGEDRGKYERVGWCQSRNCENYQLVEDEENWSTITVI